MNRPTVYHIPVCPFCQRLDILLTLKGRRDEIDFQVIDITRPRPDWLLQKTRGTTALPVLETADGHSSRKSVILQYLRMLSGTSGCPARILTGARENMLTCDGMANSSPLGYGWLMNQDPARREVLRGGMLKQYASTGRLSAGACAGRPFCSRIRLGGNRVHADSQRFWFLEYYEGIRAARR